MKLNLEANTNIDSQYDKIMERINKLNYSDVELIDQLYENSNSSRKKEIISKLEIILDYISNLKPEEDLVKRSLFEDLIDCKKWGLFPRKREHLCFKCILENRGDHFIEDMNDLAKYHLEKQNFEYSIFILKNLIKSDMTKELENKHTYYQSIAKAYNGLDNKEKELKYYKKALETLPSKRDLSSEGINILANELYLNKRIGKLYFYLKNYESALTFLKKIKNPKIDEIKLKLKSMVNLKKHLECYYIIKGFPSFVKNDQEIVKIKEIIKNNMSSSDQNIIENLDALLEKAELAFKKEKFEDALKHYLDLLSLASKNDIVDYFRNVKNITKLIQRRLAKEASQMKANKIGTPRISGEMSGNSIADLEISKKSLKKKKAKSSKIKKLLKKNMKGITKTAGKMAGEMAGDLAGDKISELTGNAEIGQIAGKIASKGVQKITQKGMEQLASKGLDLSFKEGQTASNSIKASEQILKSSIVPLKVDLRERLLGIIKAKKRVKIEYFEKYLKLPREEIMGMIFDLIGKGKISGKFDEDDSEFTLSDNL